MLAEKVGAMKKIPPTIAFGNGNTQASVRNQMFVGRIGAH
jgi:hypothetical protein